MSIDLSALVAVDVETSGPDPFSNQLLAFAFVPCDSTLPTLDVYVRPDTIAWSEVGRRYFRAYQKNWEAQAVSPEVAFEQLRQYLEALPRPMKLVGHNIGFDFAFLKQLLTKTDQEWFPRLSHRTIDTHTLLQALTWLKKLPPSACSSDGAFRYFQIAVPSTERHTALGDAKATAKLIATLMAEFERHCEVV